MGCAAIIGALIAFPAGMMFAGHEAVRGKAASPMKTGHRAGQPGARNFYSPTIFDDPYVREQHRGVVEALEAQCRNQGEHCAEAKQARRWMEQQEMSD